MQRMICNVCSVDTGYTDNLKRIKGWFSNNGISKFDNNALDLIHKLGLMGAFRHNVYCRFGIGGCAKIEKINAEQNALSKEVCYLLVTYIYNKDFSNIKSLLRLFQGYFPREYRILENEYYKNKHKKESE